MPGQLNPLSPDTLQQGQLPTPLQPSQPNKPHPQGQSQKASLPTSIPSEIADLDFSLPTTTDGTNPSTTTLNFSLPGTIDSAPTVAMTHSAHPSTASHSAPPSQHMGPPSVSLPPTGAQQPHVKQEKPQTAKQVSWLG